MEQYIQKDALVAEIDRRIKCIIKESQERRHPSFFLLGKITGLENIRLFLETIEIREVDLEKSISNWLSEGLPNDEEEIDYIKETAKHFFELGLKAQKGEEV